MGTSPDKHSEPFHFLHFLLTTARYHKCQGSLATERARL